MIDINISDQLTGALCNTLMHSLWQGVILAAIAGLIVIGTRKASSGLRYNLLISALMLFAVAVSATFVSQYLRGSAVSRTQPVTYQVQGMHINTTTDPGPQPASQPDFTRRIETYLGDHHNAIVLVWFLIICARSLQLGVGLYATCRLRRVRVFAVSDRWRDRVQQLAGGLAIKQAIGLLESGLARTPMVIGHLKPLVLVPIGLLAALSTEEVEAILIHELAHIKRRDYLVNMLQSLLEIIFFFNPAVLWISKLIKTERENCCDDLAVAQNHSKVNYIRALVSCEEYKSSVPPFAMAFPGGKNSLLHRVKRLVGNRNHSLNLFEKTMLAVCLVGVGLFMTAFSSLHHQPQHIQAPSDIQAVSTPPMSTQAASTQPSTTRSTLAQSAPAQVAPSRPTPVQVAPAEHAAAPTPAQLMPALPTSPQHKQESAPKDTAVTPPASESATATPSRRGPTIPDLGDTLVKYNIIPVKTDMTARLNSAELVINGEKQPEAVRALVFSKFLDNGSHSVDIDYVYKSVPDSAKAYVDPYRNAGYNNRPYRSGYNRYADQQARYKSDEAKIKIDLITEGLVSDTNHIHFTINEREFILNGVPQSPAVFRRYKDKYDATNGSGWSWTHGTERSRD
jgi:bla regulator protein blaR1